jgi:hypothetical protein
MSLGAQNKKMRSDVLGTSENETGSAKYENGTRRPRYRRKRVWERKKFKTSPDALGTSENESASAKHEN